MVKRAKTPHTNTKNIEALKTVEREYYQDMFTLQLVPVSEDYLLHFALQWVEQALKDEDMLTLADFYIAKGIQAGTVHRWADRCPELKQAREHVKAILGNRREKGAITRKYDAGMVRYTMPMYNVEWKEIEEWRENLKQKVDSTNASAEIIATVAREMLRPLKNKE